MDAAQPTTPAPKIPQQLPQPEEKLLRAPTFWEKYSWLKSVLLIVLLIGIIDIGIYYLVRSDPKDAPPPVPENPSYNLLPSPTVVPTVDPTLNWISYENQQGQFTLRYPEDYVLTDNVPNAPESIQIQSPIISTINAAYLLTITYKPVTDNPKLSELIDQNSVCNITSDKPGITSLLNNQIGAVLYIDTACGEKPKTVIYTQSNNMLYIITVDSTVPFDKTSPYAEQIISTLEFIKSTQVSPTTGVACTQEAKQCPDGSFVGRNGPNCEFAACPVTQ